MPIVSQRYEIKDPVVGRIKDEIVKARTGKIWEEWYQLLDGWDALGKGFTQTARYLRHHYGLTAWWSNTVASRYEWVRGLRN